MGSTFDNRRCGLLQVFRVNPKDTRPGYGPAILDIEGSSCKYLEPLGV